MNDAAAGLCQETVMRMLEPHRRANPHAGEPEYRRLVELEDGLAFRLCRLGFTASEVAEYLMTDRLVVHQDADAPGPPTRRRGASTGR